jgi:hypothetical protein
MTLLRAVKMQQCRTETAYTRSALGSLAVSIKLDHPALFYAAMQQFCAAQQLGFGPFG